MFLQPRLIFHVRLLFIMKAKRKAIRETWGHFALVNDVRMMFFVGQTGEKERQYIRDENFTYGDITQGNFDDHYDNLTLKTVSMLQWVKDYCSQVRSFFYLQLIIII
jgi:hypothetical protein